MSAYTPERIAKERKLIMSDRTREAFVDEMRHPKKFPHCIMSYSGWGAALDEIERLQAGFLDLFGDDDISLRTEAFVSALVYRRNAEGDGLRGFLAFQSAFTFALDAESPALQADTVSALAPSQKAGAK